MIARRPEAALRACSWFRYLPSSLFGKTSSHQVLAPQLAHYSTCGPHRGSGALLLTPRLDVQTGILNDVRILDLSALLAYGLPPPGSGHGSARSSPQSSWGVTSSAQVQQAGPDWYHRVAGTNWVACTEPAAACKEFARCFSTSMWSAPQ